MYARSPCHQGPEPVQVSKYLTMSLPSIIHSHRIHGFSCPLHRWRMCHWRSLLPRGAKPRRISECTSSHRYVERLGARRGIDGDRPHCDNHRYFLFRIPISRLDVTRRAEIAACGRYSIRYWATTQRNFSPGVLATTCSPAARCYYSALSTIADFAIRIGENWNKLCLNYTFPSAI